MALVLLVPMAKSSASPLPPRSVVNHEIEACGEVFGGDECMSCRAEAGWTLLGEAECPAGYATEVPVPHDCSPFKSHFCCTEGHSGAPGDCEDVIVNEAERHCAFVEDLAACTALPAGWTPAPRDSGWPVCPSWDYRWVEARCPRD